MCRVARAAGKPAGQVQFVTHIPASLAAVRTSQWRSPEIRLKLERPK
jgi:hypothetical protein